MHYQFVVRCLFVFHFEFSNIPTILDLLLFLAFIHFPLSYTWLFPPILKLGTLLSLYCLVYSGDLAN